MLKQIVVGERKRPIKYHGMVTHIVFSCNLCGKEFEKQQSYVKKQMKKRPGACCFCSPECRKKYLKQTLSKPAGKKQAKHVEPAPHKKNTPTQQKKTRRFWSFFTEKVFIEEIE